MMNDPDDPDRDALFYIEGPDERGCVWIHGANSANPWSQRLGPQDRVVHVLSRWLNTIKFDEIG